MSAALLRCCNTAEPAVTPRYKRRLAAAIATLALATLAGCGGSSTDAYCGAVTSNQHHLSSILGEGGDAALLRALPVFRTLQAKAPNDVRDDWNTVVTRLTALQKALQDAHVDPATYDAKHPPAGLSAADQQAIATAATRLGSTATITALNAVQQQSRDVCHTPLSL